MSTLLDRAGLIQDLHKALEAGNYNATPGSLTQGGALQIEDVSPVMENVVWTDKQLVLQQLVEETPCRSTLAQFDRYLAAGNFGGSAQLEGAVGQEDNIDVVRIVVPMVYYSQVRKTTLVADLVKTVDGQTGSDRQSEGAAKVIAGDVEFDLFRGCDDFNNAGFYDGNPLAVADVPNMRGLFMQIRQSDTNLNSHDLMMDEFGSDETVDINVSGFLDQSSLDNARMRAEMNNSPATLVVTDPRVLYQYNKISYGMSRIILGGAPQRATGADLSKQFTANGGELQLKPSRFLAGKTSPARKRLGGPNPPTLTSVTSFTDTTKPTSFVIGQKYKYMVTAVTEVGESDPSSVVTGTVGVTADTFQVLITPGAGTTRYFNVYRSVASGTKCRFIGRIRNSGSTTTTFVDLNLRIPGFTTTVLVDDEVLEMKQLSAYSRLKLGIHELAKPEAHYRFVTLAVKKPRNCVLLSNTSGIFLDQ